MPEPPRLPDLTGRTVLVTGANAGLGFWATVQLAAAGAQVVMACRSAVRAADALARVRALVPAARPDVVPLDLADLSSVGACARDLDIALDGVLCNAGITGTRGRRTTADGLELMMGGNAFGHFALLAGLAPRLRPGARVVTVGSIAHRWSPLDLDDLQAEQNFRSFRQYGRSKSAAMVVAFELDRRWRAAGRRNAALAAHPGFAVDVLDERRADGRRSSPGARLLGRAARGLLQGKAAGAWPLVHALVGQDAVGGQYWGPGGRQELQGRPALSQARAHTRSEETGAALWAAAEQATGVRFDVAHDQPPPRTLAP